MALLLLTPAAVIFGLVIVAPVLNGLATSFQDATLANRGEEQWIGLDNYRRLFASGDVYVFVSNTLVFVSATVGSLLVLGTGLALLLHSKIPLRRTARTLFIIPWVVPTVVVALLWTWIFQPQYGILNYLLSSVGLVAADQQWLTDMTLAMPAVVVAAVWKELPLMTLLVLAGLQTVPDDILEASRVDGAGALRSFWHVTLPSLRPTLATALLLAIVNNFQSFTLIYTMTAGGPLGETATLSIGTYEAAFRSYDLGLGSALGVIWLVMLVLIAFGFNRISERDRA